MFTLTAAATVVPEGYVPAVVAASNATTMPELVAAGLALMAAIGGALRYVITRMDAQAQLEREEQSKERDRLVASWNEKFALVQSQLNTTLEELGRLRRNNERYVRHVGALEGIMRAKGIEVPNMEHLE